MTLPNTMAGNIYRRRCVLHLRHCIHGNNTLTMHAQIWERLKMKRQGINQIRRMCILESCCVTPDSIGDSPLKHCGMGSYKLFHCHFSLMTIPQICNVSQSSMLCTTQTKYLLHTSIPRHEFEAEHGDGKDIPTQNQERNTSSEIKNSEDLSPVTNQKVMSAANNKLNVAVLEEQYQQKYPPKKHTVMDSEDALDILSEQTEHKIVDEFAELPLLPTSYTLASYVEHSEVLQKLVQLGVDLSKVQKRQGISTKLLQMNFDPQITEKISFLHFVGVESDNLGNFLTKNPHILLEDQGNLEKRVEYLKSKKFDKIAIAQIVNRAPYFLCFSVERIDNRLGFYQQTLNLTGDELRQIITTCPKLMTHKLSRSQENMFVLKQQFGFHSNEVKTLVLSHPQILIRGKYKLISIFDYLHSDMGISHKMILQNYQVFNSRVFQLQERHQFLKKIGHAQYDPTEPGYVSLKKMVTLPDDVFCDEIGKTTIEEYNDFLKTL